MIKRLESGDVDLIVALTEGLCNRIIATSEDCISKPDGIRLLGTYVASVRYPITCGWCLHV